MFRVIAKFFGLIETNVNTLDNLSKIGESMSQIHLNKYLAQVADTRVQLKLDDKNNYNP